MESFDRGACACEGFGRRNQLGAATLNLFNAPLHLHRLSLLDLVVREQAGNQSIGELGSLLGRELQRLRFNRL
jgi:hypothetical protein